ncbi:MAG: PD-(D/E)XK nuclease-like domain-containing protein [Hyphomicrobiales bacterium]
MTEHITEDGIYSDISLERYHNDLELFDGPSVSKSSLKYMLPPHSGSPKKFWGHWKYNPEHVQMKSTKPLAFGRASHCLMLGDEVFNQKFVLRPDKVEGKPWHSNRTACKEWVQEQTDKELTIVTTDQIERIRLMSLDAANYPLVKNAGLLNGKVEQSIVARDPDTGIWLKVRPDNEPSYLTGVYADLKTTSSMDENFLQRQLFDSGYYLQGAMTRMVCRMLGKPFESFVFLYVLNDDVPDTAHVELSEHELDRGERAIRWCLDQIKHGLDTGDWPGHRPFKDGTLPIQSKPWAADKLDNFLNEQEHLSQPALEAAE